MAAQNPVIVLPGITASNLRDEYPVVPDTVWSAVLNKSFDRIALHPDNLKYEREEPARVTVDSVFSLVYRELISELRNDLSPRREEPTPVYPFAYDWRHPLERIEAQLEAFIDEVIERTMLLRHYHRERYQDNPKVDLVGHSMGGLIIAGYLQRKGRDARVGKVATLGTPFRGSLEAVLKMTTGTAALGAGSSSSREREVARLTPALYYLLPSFEGAVNPDPGIPATMFDPRTWQPSIVATIEDYIRLHAVDRTQRHARAQAMMILLLGHALQHRIRVESLELSKAGMKDDDWLCVVGVDETTRVSLEIQLKGGKPEFNLASTDSKGRKARANEWKSNNPAERVLTGDGTVPYLGARTSFVPTERVVCVSDADFGYWELADRLMNGPLGVGLHGMLPKMNLIHRLIVSHFKSETRKGTWGRRPPDLPAGRAWNPPIRNLSEKK